MKMPKINKNIILAVALIVVAVVGYYLLRGGKEETPPLTETQAGVSSSAIGQEIVIELNRLKALRNINSDIFKNPAFASLQDFTQVVVPQPIGRPNPFAPVGF